MRVRPKVVLAVATELGSGQWTMKAYDENGHLRSGISTPSSRKYIDAKIEEWFPAGIAVRYDRVASRSDPGVAAYNRGSRAISRQIDRDTRERRTTTATCGGRMANGPNKNFARCSKCGHVDYEKYEGDRCDRTVTTVRR